MSKVAVVTGAGSGVGQAVVVALAERGWDVALIGTRKQTLDETAKLVKNPKGKLLVIPCDVADDKSVHAMAEQVVQKLGVPEVLVNSAGTNIKQRSLAELSREDFRRVIDVNLTGSYLCVYEFLPLMRKAGKGTLIHIISDAGVKPTPKQALRTSLPSSLYEGFPTRSISRNAPMASAHAPFVPAKSTRDFRETSGGSVGGSKNQDAPTGGHGLCRDDGYRTAGPCRYRGNADSPEVNQSYMPQLVQPVQRSDAICFSQRRKIEDVVNKIIHLAAERHDGLADVDQLGGACADDMDSQDRVIFLMDQQLEHASGSPRSWPRASSL